MTQTRDAMISQRLMMTAAQVIFLPIALASCSKQPATPTCEPGSPADTAAPDTAALDATTEVDAADSSAADTSRPAAALELPLGTSVLPVSGDMAKYLSWVALDTTDISIHPQFDAHVALPGPSAASTKVPIYLPTGWQQIPLFPWLCPDGNSAQGSRNAACLANYVSTAFWITTSIGDKRFRIVLSQGSPNVQYFIERANIDGSGAVAAKVVGEKSNDAGWPRAVSRPGLPQIRTCAIHASGSSKHRFATRGPGLSERCAVAVEGSGQAWR